MDDVRIGQAENACKPETHVQSSESPGHDSAAAESARPVPEVFQFLLHKDSDACSIIGCLALASVSHLKRIAGWHSRFSTRPESVHAELHHGEAHFSMCKSVVDHGSFESLCPWSGEKIFSTQSFVVESRPYGVPLYAYRFETKEVFYVLVLGSVTCCMAGLYFPQHRIFVSFDCNGDNEAAEKYAFPLRDFLIRHAADVSAYLARGQSGCAVLVSSYHFAHHMWNELSAVHDLVRSDKEKLTFWVIKSPIGPLNKLYPELSPEQIHDCTAMPFEQAALMALRAGICWAPLGRTYIPRDLPRRIFSVASDLHPLDCDFSAKIRERAAFILWVSVRTDARVCLNQASLIAAAITKSFDKFGSVAVIFDGHTPGYRGHMDTQTQEEQDQIVDKVCRLTTVPFVGISLIGADLLQAAVWGSVCDFYIANHGSIQHKIGWIHDKPGICHYFKKAGFAPENFGAIHAREKCIVPHYILGNPVERDGKATDPRHDLFSYHIDLDDFISRYEDMISALDLPKQPMPATNQTVFRLREDPYLLELSLPYLAKGDRSWGRQDIPAAIENFAKAWSMAPKHPRAMNRMIEFSLMNLVSWRRESGISGTRLLALQLILSLNQGNRWAWTQLYQELLKMEDEPGLVGTCVELGSRFPDFIIGFIDYANEKSLPIPAELAVQMNTRV